MSQVNISTDVFLNVVKRVEEVVYRSSVNSNSVNVSFVRNEELNSTDNLSIVDRSGSLQANRVFDADFTVITDTDFFSIDTDNFIVTDIFVEASETILETPLFYKHILSTDNVSRVDVDNGDYTLDTNIKLISLEILDQSLNILRISDKSIDYDRGILYSNLLSEFKDINDYTVYYVRYTINDNNIIRTFVDLLDNEPVYKEAEFSDLTLSLTIIDDGRKVFLLEETEDGFDITLPTESTYAYQVLSTSKIQILPPVSQTVDDPWFVKVSNGTFFTNIFGSLYKYHVAEFSSQTFNPEPPIKYVSTEESTILSSNLIKLDQQNIETDEDLSLFISILINKANGDGAAALTTNPDLVDTIANNGTTWKQWDIADKIGIRSIDRSAGILDIEGVNLKSTWIVESTYYFKEKNYEFTSFNFNPITTQDAINHRISLFIDPDTILTNKTKTLYYLKIDQAGKVVESDWSLFSNTDQVYTVDSLPLYYDAYPSFLPAGENHHVFIDEFSTEVTPVTSGINTTEFLVLGDISVFNAQDISEVSLIDTRQRGGGITTSGYETVLGLQPEAQWYTDRGYWDGVPYPGNASYLAEIPVDILDGTPSGIFTQSHIRDIVERHTVAGVYPLIRAYGPGVTITGIIPAISGFTVKWCSYGF